jgi:hypothetical protein
MPYGFTYHKVVKTSVSRVSRSEMGIINQGMHPDVGCPEYWTFVEKILV